MTNTTTAAIKPGDIVRRVRASSPRLARQVGRVLKTWAGDGIDTTGPMRARVQFAGAPAPVILEVASLVAVSA